MALSPLVAIAHTCLAIAWFVGYFLIGLPALCVFGLLYEVWGWTPTAAGLVSLAVLPGWVYLLNRLPVASLVDDFYDSGPKACALWGGALFAVVPALLVGALLGYYLGYLDDMSWQGGERQGLVGAILGGIYGFSVGLLVPVTTAMARILVEE